jgi:hypothetical protein
MSGIQPVAATLVGDIALARTAFGLAASAVVEPLENTDWPD